MFRDQRIAAYVMGDMPVAERAAFERTIIEDPEALAELVAQQCLDAGLRALLDPSADCVCAAIMATVRGPSDETAIDNVLSDTVRQKPVWRPARPAWLDWIASGAWRPWLRPALAVFVTAMALTTWLVISHRIANYYPDELVSSSDPEAQLSENGVARLTHEAGVVWDQKNGADLETGVSLSPGWLRLKSGVVGLEFAGGAETILEGPAELRLISSGEAHLLHGKISAHVPPPAHGFRVRTAGAVVTDLGTDFAINKPSAKAPEVDVFTGRVEVALADTNHAPLTLTQGQAARIRLGGVDDLHASPQNFVSNSQLEERETAESATRISGWKELCKSMDSDPDLLVHLVFEKDNGAGDSLPNVSRSPHALSGAKIQGANWTDGRWAGKGALAFAGSHDILRLPPPGRLQSLTYLTWVRVASLPDVRNGLALMETGLGGETHWQIRNDGRIEFSVRRRDEEAAWDELFSPPLITAEHFGAWMQLAAVYDHTARQSSLYVNGRLVATRKLGAQPRDLVLGPLFLGNWETTSKAGPDYRNRAFHGRMDEFAIFSRALSPQEIQQHYECGRPQAPLEAGSRNFTQTGPQPSPDTPAQKSL